jgi:hypothetical protein
MFGTSLLASICDHNIFVEQITAKTTVKAPNHSCSATKTELIHFSS